MKNKVCSRILFAPQCGKQCRILAKCPIGENLQSGRSQDSEFQVIRKTIDQATAKTESEFQSSPWLKIET